MALPENNVWWRACHWGRSWLAREAGPFNQSSRSVSPLARTSVAKAREASAMSLGISGYRMSQSLVNRDTTPSKLSAATDGHSLELKMALSQILVKPDEKVVCVHARYHYNRYPPI